MRILYVVHQFFPRYYTGTERLVLNLSKQMQRMGHSVKVLTYGITENEGFRQEGDFLIKEYEFQGVPVIAIRHKIIPQEVSFTIFDPEMEKILEEIFSNEEFDIIHVCHPMRVGSIIRVAKHRNIPVVLTLTDFWLMCPRGIAVTQKGELCHTPENGMKCVRECYGNLWKDKLIQRFNETNEVFQTVDCVVCATNFLKQIFKINNFSSNIKLIPFGKDYRNVRHNKREYSEKSEITLGFLSTLLPHKGAHVLLEAFNRVNLENIRIEVYGDYFGEIDYYNRVKKIAKENKKIEFCGKYKYEEMPDIFDEIDMLVLPSIWWENSPLVLLRALAHNVPAIVSDLGGMTEVIDDGKNGFTFKAGSAESLAEILRKVGGNPSILNELKSKIHYPPRIEEEAFKYEKIYGSLSRIVSLTGDIPVPPKGLIFIGDGDFKAVGEVFVQYFIELCGLKQNERVLDVGCGVGRMAIPLTKYLDKNGSYEGFDIVKRGIDWCKKNISSKYRSFHFQVADIFNKYYNPGGKYKSVEYKFPYENESFDFVFLTSVFTHMFPQDMENYFSEIARVLRKGGRCFITFFLLNEESLKLIDAKKSAADFEYVFEGYYTTDKNTPEAAIGYDELFIRKLYDKYGLNIEEPIRYGSWCGREKFLSYQDIIIASKNMNEIRKNLTIYGDNFFFDIKNKTYKSIGMFNRNNLKIITRISKRDTKFQGNLDHYFSVGMSALHCIEIALFIVNKKSTDIKKILDFACGYGRVMRIIKAAFPKAAITACELDKEAVDYCVKTFSATPAYSSKQVSEIKIEDSFDLIWIGSLLTHLDSDLWAGYVHLFESLLKSNGILIFTVHGCLVADKLKKGDNNYYGLDQALVSKILKDYEDHGFGYVNYCNETDYGISISSRSWVLSCLENISNLQVLTYAEHLWDNQQDVVICIKDSEWDRKSESKVDLTTSGMSI